MNVPPPVHTPLVLLQRCSFGLSPTHRPTDRPSTPLLLAFGTTLPSPPSSPTERECTLASFGPCEGGRERERKSEGPLCSDGSMSSEEASQEGRRCCCCGCCCCCCSRQTYFSRKRKLLSPAFWRAGFLVVSNARLGSLLFRRLDLVRTRPPPSNRRGESPPPPRTPNTARTYCNVAPKRTGRGKGGSVYK